MQGTITYDDASGQTNDEAIKFTIHKYGDITHDYETDDLCTEIGPVFNPLQDPHNTGTETRGTIDDLIVDTDAQVDVNVGVQLSENKNGCVYCCNVM